MRKRTSRLVVALVILAVGVAGGFFVFDEHQSIDAFRSSSRDVSERIDRLIAIAGDIAYAQQAYVAMGQPVLSWLDRSTAAIHQFGADLEALRPLLQSTEAANLIDESDRAFRALATIDGTSRSDLQQDQNLLAADLIFSEGRQAVRTLVRTLQDLQRAEQNAATSRRLASERRQEGILGGVAVLWTVGLLALAFFSPKAPAVVPAAGSFLSVGDALDSSGDMRPAVDLAAAADVCTSLAAIARVEALPDVLARAAAVLDAYGIIVWMGAGEELFPALVYGYDDRMVGRMGSLARNAANPTAEAWRTGRLCTVAAGTTSRGALAVPLSGLSGCVGVLAAEVRHGRENDPSTRAVAALIAAQLVSIVSAWPAASEASSEQGVNSGGLTATRRA